MLARTDGRKRTIAMAVGVSLLLVLFVAGLAFANSIGAARVAENASSLHWANATLGTSSLTRAALVQAVTFVELEQQVSSPTRMLPTPLHRSLPHTTS